MSANQRAILEHDADVLRGRTHTFCGSVSGKQTRPYPLRLTLPLIERTVIDESVTVPGPAVGGASGLVGNGSAARRSHSAEFLSCGPDRTRLAQSNNHRQDRAE
jgi:hypothetical protein